MHCQKQQFRKIKTGQSSAMGPQWVLMLALLISGECFGRFKSVSWFREARSKHFMTPGLFIPPHPFLFLDYQAPLHSVQIPKVLWSL